MLGFSLEKFKSLEAVDIYKSQEDDEPTLADQADASVAGGGNSSDASDNSQGDDADQSQDVNIDMGDSSGDMGGGNLGGGDMGGNTSGDDSLNGGDAGSDQNNISNEPSNPNENAFKKQNGEAKLDQMLANLQTAVSSISEKVRANPKIEFVVVSELDDLLDSIKKLRETVFISPIEFTEYRYKLAVASYALLSKSICEHALKERQ